MPFTLHKRPGAAGALHGCLAPEAVNTALGSPKSIPLAAWWVFLFAGFIILSEPVGLRNLWVKFLSQEEAKT